MEHSTECNLQLLRLGQGLIYSFGEEGVQPSKFFSVTINVSIGSIGMRACELAIFSNAEKFSMFVQSPWELHALFSEGVYISRIINCHMFGMTAH